MNFKTNDMNSISQRNVELTMKPCKMAAVGLQCMPIESMQVNLTNETESQQTAV